MKKISFSFQRPPLFATILVLAAVGVLCLLGIWQVQRLHWKTGILARMDAAAVIDPMSRPLDGETIARASDFEKGVVRGGFLHDLEIAIGPRTHDGAAGYHILTPFRMTDGAFLFVNRGWVPLDKRQASSRPESLVRTETFVAGALRVPSREGFFVPLNDSTRENWYRYDLPAMARARELPAPLPMILYAEKEESLAPFPIREALTLRPPNDHLSYALFWFTMAVVLSAIFLFRFVIVRKT